MLSKKRVRQVKQVLFLLQKYWKQYCADFDHERGLFFVVGCQRSGTTVLLRLFEKDLRTKVFHEYGRTSNQGKDKIRLNPYASLRSIFNKSKPPLIIVKPLVESQNTLSLLKGFEESKALWMYRHYKDVASSNIVQWGECNGINNLRPIYNGEGDNWRSENLPQSLRDLVRKYFSEDMGGCDAAVLFWCVRNMLYFELNLDSNENVLLYKYEDLIQRPTVVMSDIYIKMNQVYPGDWMVDELNAQSLKKGASITLSAEIETLAEELWSRLEASYNKVKP